MRRSVSIVRWKRNSSSIRASEARDAKRERARAASPLSKLISALQNEVHRIGEALPFVDLLAECLPPLTRDAVVACTPVVLGGLPIALDVAAVLETLQRRIERTLIDLEAAVRDLLNAKTDAPPMHGCERHRLEDEEVDAPPKGVGFLWVARCHCLALL